MAIQKTANSPHTPPYSINEDSGYGKINDLFTQLFRDKANLGLKEMEGLSKDEIAPQYTAGTKQIMPTKDKELFFNKTADGYDLCARIGGDVYKISMNKM